MCVCESHPNAGLALDGKSSAGGSSHANAHPGAHANAFHFPDPAGIPDGDCDCLRHCYPTNRHRQPDANSNPDAFAIFETFCASADSLPSS